jgi:hypothetical protein
MTPTTFEKRRSRLFEEVIIKSWWMILFFFLCYFLYDEGVARRNLEKAHLNKKLTDLYAEKEKVLRIQRELKEQIESQGDHAWIELTLMKGLGLVPEGERKVCFLKKEG